MMSETISVLFNMDDYNVILIPPCDPMATAVLLYRVCCEISRSCGWSGQLLPFHAHIFQVSFQGSEAYPRGRYEEMLAGVVFLLPCALPVIFWRLAGERADFSRDVRLVL